MQQLKDKGTHLLALLQSLGRMEAKGEVGIAPSEEFSAGGVIYRSLHQKNRSRSGLS